MCGGCLSAKTVKARCGVFPAVSLVFSVRRHALWITRSAGPPCAALVFPRKQPRTNSARFQRFCLFFRMQTRTLDYAQRRAASCGACLSAESAKVGFGALPAVPLVFCAHVILRVATQRWTFSRSTARSDEFSKPSPTFFPRDDAYFGLRAISVCLMRRLFIRRIR